MKAPSGATSNPLIAGMIRARGLFVTGPLETVRATSSRHALLQRVLAFLRRTVFDRFGRDSPRV